MGDVYNNQTLKKGYMSISSEFHQRCYPDTSSSIYHVVTLTIACIGLPLVVAAIIALYSLIRKDHVAPIYIINLLISDLIELCCMIIMGQEYHDMNICVAFFNVYIVGLSVNICFMVVISLERYLMIARPLWYKFRRNIKTSVIVSVVVWLFSLLHIPVIAFAGYCTETIIASFLLLPFPLLIFFLVGTLKALSAARSVPTDEKRRIVAVLVLVLLIYTLLFLPVVIAFLSDNIIEHQNYEIVTFLPVFFSPLVDLFLYVFMRKGIFSHEKLLACICCCKMDHDDAVMTMTTMTMPRTVSSTHSDRPEQEEREDGEKKDGTV